MKNLLSRFKSLPIKTRQILSAGILLALVVVLPLSIWAIMTQRFELRKKALTSGSVLTIEPSNISVNPGGTFQVQVAINTGDDTISASELHLTYDSNNFEVQSITAGSYLPVVLTQGQVGGGVASITLGSQPAVPKKGTGILATLSFKALSPSTTQIDFRSDTAVAAIGESGNRIASMTGGQVSVLGPTQSPTTIPTPSSTPTQIPEPVDSCTGQSDGVACFGGGCPSPWPSSFACTRPIFTGTCQNQVCVSTIATPTPTPTICEYPAPPSGCYYDTQSVSNIYPDCAKLVCPPTPSSSSCPSGDKGNLDCDADGLINTTDLSILLASWSGNNTACPTTLPGRANPDLNGDCKVDTTDLSILLANWKSI